MKNFFRILLAIYGFGSNLITYITGAKAVAQFLKEYMHPLFADFIVIILNPLLLGLLSLYAFFLLLIYVTKPYRKQIGTHGIECKLIRMFRYKFGIKKGKVIRIIHKKLYHESYIIKTKIRKDRSISYDTCKHNVADYIKTVNHSIRQIFGIDLNLNVKQLAYNSNNEFILTPYAHYRNDYAASSVNERSFHYKYIISTEEQPSLEAYANSSKHYNNTHGGRLYKTNSIFNYLINGKKTFWMTNDLTIDQQNNIFYTSSDNYPENYKSLAIFKIIPPEKDVLPEGFIIFDSEKCGLFSEEICAQIMGLVAHFLYEIFFEINEYEKKNVQQERKAPLSPLFKKGRKRSKK